ncbi:DUF4013 domain-containing protein [Natrinema salifodinae]|uniref:DUF4013 domain-containing protein n=1 Tax=Natrinema salifodinae TaxID=1202768 RepID=A0A1I0N5B8_9EURY|nr:DUF4013 domain-containing protein [Natrinema salifodinae]SEV96056.1 Protein of unknown function [Natrinema salifodinae]
MALLVDEGLRYPFRGDRSPDLLAIGGLLGIFTAICLQLAVAVGPSPLAVPFVALAAVSIIALLGYLFRVVAATVAGDETPPGFRPLGRLLRDGCRLLAVSIGYAIGPTVVLAVTVGGLVRRPFDPDAIGFGGSLLFFGASTVVLSMVLAFGYVYPAAVGRLATGGGLREAVDVRPQRSVLAHGGYFTAWLCASLFVVPGWAFLIAALSNATAFGVVAAFVTFYAHVVAARLVGRGYRRAATIER